MTTTPAPGTPTPAVSAPPRTLSILSLVAAIASIPLGHFVILPVAAIVLGFFAHSREPWARTMSNWGIGLGFAILFGWVLVGVIAFSLWLPFTMLHLLH